MSKNPFSKPITTDELLQIPEIEETLDELVDCANLVAEKIQEKNDIGKLQYWEDLDKVVKNEVNYIMFAPTTATDGQTRSVLIGTLDTMVYFLIRHLMTTHPDEG